MSMITIVAAMTENRVIGRDGDLPWSLPADLRRFMKMTMGHTLVMGRRTFASLPGPLPGRVTIVLSRDPAFRAEGVTVAPDLDSALAAAGDGEVFIAGGSAIYAAALPIADRMELTLVHADVEGDTLFPPFDEDAWRLVAEEHHPADERHAHAFSYLGFERQPTSSTGC